MWASLREIAIIEGKSVDQVRQDLAKGFYHKVSKSEFGGFRIHTHYTKSQIVAMERDNMKRYFQENEKRAKIVAAHKEYKGLGERLAHKYSEMEERALRNNGVENQEELLEKVNSMSREERKQDRLNQERIRQEKIEQDRLNELEISKKERFEALARRRQERMGK